MNSLRISVFSRVPNLLKELVKVLPSINFHEVTDPKADPYFKNSEILICDFDLLGPYLYDLPAAKWVQGTWAGFDRLTPSIQENKPITFQVTRFTGEHFGRIMSEYVVTNIVNHERCMFDVKGYQQQQQWKRNGKIAYYRVISDLTIGILGLGSIGNRIGKVLNVFGARILAFGRRPALPDTGEYSHVSKYYTKETLDSLLKECDYIINLLPKTKETDGLLDNNILQNCKDKHSVIINVGRSNIICEDSLIKALKNKWLSAAILDVFDEEPLPESSPLWRMEQVFITPHVAAMTRAKDVAQQFKSNLTSYLNKLPLPGTIDFNKGY